jgi:hypothetical protein
MTTGSDRSLAVSIVAFAGAILSKPGREYECLTTPDLLRVECVSLIALWTTR